LTALPGTTGRRRIYLMRHGHVDYFGPEIRAAGGDPKVVPLTPLGQEQAKAAGQALSHVALDRAVCSGVPRTRQTAEYVLAAQQGKAPSLEVVGDLVEIHGGSFGEVKSRAELAARMAYHFDMAGEPGATMLDGGEVFAEALERSVSAVKKLLAEPGWHTMLITAHEGINRLVLGWAATGCSIERALTAVRSFEQDPACINVLDFDMVPAADGSIGTEIERALIKSVNVTPYNYVKHGMNLTSLESIFNIEAR
jgi:probable phosphoglycerate mutase|tara:strand:+ start:10339 stop:11097 length:759 start_codon:yes stop_codon:yes gene_type:complete